VIKESTPFVQRKMVDMELCEWGKYSSRSIIDHTFRLKMILNKKINVIKEKILN
jgi:hypothetical protein